jgi:two-component system, chemotaxis family, chemotaxis protein CheY
MKILIVDDSPTTRRIVGNVLRSIGYTDIVEAYDGADGLTKLRTHKIEFLITDWNMPNMSGIELIRHIRKNENLRNMPVIVVSVRGTKEDVLEAVDASVNSYIIKPFTPEVLKEKIEQVLQTV